MTGHGWSSHPQPSHPVRGRRMMCPFRSFVPFNQLSSEVSSETTTQIQYEADPKAKVKYPISNHVSTHRLSAPHAMLIKQLDSLSTPSSVEEALMDPNWKQAMNDEMQALQKNSTWELVPLPSGKRTVGCRWIYTIKLKADGSIERYKARLVAKGYTQRYGVDYQETFAPVAKINTVRILISLAANLDWPLHQFDVKNAFLHGDLEEEVYMDPPRGCDDPDERKALQEYLSKEFEMKDLGTLKYFLGIEVSRSHQGIFLSQRKYVMDLLTETRMMGCKPVNTPMEENHKLGECTDHKPTNKEQYQRLVGRLIYLSHTRPDMAHGVCELLWIKHVLTELGFKPKKPMKLYCDNIAAINIAHNPV
ncbi:unnamed protein product [Prunus brigantina]